ncbi:MAG: hypothetical protein HZB46_13235 [Solirubrobacterales bacterium]|nr:hypothetical protein [Solirubrobacterales bacterium]
MFAVVGLLGTSSLAAAADPCSGDPMPSGCVRGVKVVDVSAYEVTRAPDGALSVKWSIDDRVKTTVDFPRPVPAGEAIARARETGVPAAGEVTAETPARAAKAPRAMASQDWWTYCDATAYAPDILFNADWQYYARAHGGQFCGSNAVSSHAIGVWLHRYQNGGWSNLPDGYGSAQGAAWNGIDAYARYNCNHQTSYNYRTWMNTYATVGPYVYRGPDLANTAWHTCPG